ncbi:cation:proton antiporter regulatory subunit [Propionibacteriaceae bacterium Y2011]
MVHTGSEMVGRALGDSGLAERDISVLTLHRGTQVVPNPRSSQVLQDQDRLLCFGNLEEMRSMIPKRRRRRVRKLPKDAIIED